MAGSGTGMKWVRTTLPAPNGLAAPEFTKMGEEAEGGVAGAGERAARAGEGGGVGGAGGEGERAAGEGKGAGAGEGCAVGHREGAGAKIKGGSGRHGDGGRGGVGAATGELQRAGLDIKRAGVGAIKEGLDFGDTRARGFGEGALIVEGGAVAGEAEAEVAVEVGGESGPGLDRKDGAPAGVDGGGGPRGGAAEIEGVGVKGFGVAGGPRAAGVGVEDTAAGHVAVVPVKGAGGGQRAGAAERAAREVDRTGN